MMQGNPKRLVLSMAALAFVPSIVSAQIEKARDIDVPGHPTKVRVWTEPGPGGVQTPFYQVSKNGGLTYNPPTETSYDLLLRFDRFDPAERQAGVPTQLAAGPENRLFVVQYWTQSLTDYRKVLQSHGAKIHRYLPLNSNIVEMDGALAGRIAELPFVRTVSPYHPAFKLEEFLVDEVLKGTEGSIVVNILSMTRGGHAKITPYIEATGGKILETTDNAHLFVAQVDFAQMIELANMTEVAWIDRWGPQEEDMNIARQFHGADFVQAMGGYDGTNVRAEVRDSGFCTSHPDIGPFLAHGTLVTSTHGCSTSGIVAGRGNANPMWTGVMPNAFLVLQSTSTATPGGSRYNASQLASDPAGSIRVVFQTNSVGSPRTLVYNATSQNMDLILFDFQRYSVCQSQSNANNQMSRPEAWAKNIIAVGGINHFDTLTKADDVWGGASIGPAADGRIKPDLASFYDRTTTTSTTGGYRVFSGTSNATPVTAGHLGLFYQMWSDGIFGNPTPGTNVFDNAPYNTTAKAMMINAATQWNFSGTSHNLTRTHQGWGHADVANLYDRRGNFFIVDETDVLEELEGTTYFFNVTGGTGPLRVTMVYRDFPGTTSSSQHRINDLTLSVVDPNGVTWQGNNGLDAGQWSTSGGPANKLDTVENVFIQNPVTGEYRVTVVASEINADTHVETADDDADYALVVNGFDSVGNSCDAPRNIKRIAGANLDALTATTATLGGTLTLTADTSGFAQAFFAGTLLPDFRPIEGGNVILVGLFGPKFFLTPVGTPGPIAQFSTPVLMDPSNCGLTVYCQSKLDDGPGTGFGMLTNSVDVVIGM